MISRFAAEGASRREPLELPPAPGFFVWAVAAEPMDGFGLARVHHLVGVRIELAPVADGPELRVVTARTWAGDVPASEMWTSIAKGLRTYACDRLIACGVTAEHRLVASRRGLRLVNDRAVVGDFAIMAEFVCARRLELAPVPQLVDVLVGGSRKPETLAGALALGLKHARNVPGIEWLRRRDAAIDERLRGLGFTPPRHRCQLERAKEKRK